MDIDDIPPWADEQPAQTTFERTVNPIQRAGDNYRTLQGYAMRETDKAILFEVYQLDGQDIDLTKREMWFPFSQVKSITRPPRGVDGSAIEYDNLTVKEWILKQKEIL